ncbi:hypothetical protein [Desulfolithobacter sp.]
MTQKKETCEVCGKTTTTGLTKCKGCARMYCTKCQSPSTSQDFCRECVAMEGVISKED